MASEKTVTIRLRADFVAWLEAQAAQHNERMAQEGKHYQVTVSDVAAPLLQDAIELSGERGDAWLVGDGRCK